ncbi:MAG: hypothetical protein H7Z42_04415 [Roseiflexaceae bacterium]|nr:hypothetical protein [Roseiflexaceae bacterium]
MLEQYDPFSRYIAEVMRHMRHLPDTQRAMIAGELRGHLEDAACEFGERAESRVVQELVVGQMGSSWRVGRALARANRNIEAERRTWMLLATLARVTAAAGATLMLAFFLLLSLFVVPPATPLTATEITGVVQSIRAPLSFPDGDMTIVLQDQRNFYVNRPYERDDFAWRQLRAEVKRGDQITLTAVEPLAWLINPLAPEPGRGVAYTPLAGVRTPTTMYLDAKLSAQNTPALFMQPMIALLLAGFVLACMLPELRRVIRFGTEGRWTRR